MTDSKILVRNPVSLTTSLVSISSSEIWLAFTSDPAAWLVVALMVILPSLSALTLWSPFRLGRSEIKSTLQSSVTIAEGLKTGFLVASLVGVLAYFINISLFLFRGTALLYLFPLLVYSLLLTVLASALASLLRFRLLVEVTPLSQLEEQGVPPGLYTVLLTSYGKPTRRWRYSFETAIVNLSLTFVMILSNFHPLAIGALGIGLGVACFVPFVIFSTHKAMEGVDLTAIMKLLRPLARNSYPRLPKES